MNGCKTVKEWRRQAGHKQMVMMQNIRKRLVFEGEVTFEHSACLHISAECYR